MPITKGMMSSKQSDWATPKDLYDFLDGQYHFTGDVCAEAWNAKHKNFITKEMDALSMPWSGVCFMNPPYGREIGKWVEKAATEAREGRATVVALIPARTDTSYWHKWIFGGAKLGLDV